MNGLVPLTPTIDWVNNKVRILDQTKLPLYEEFIETDNYKVVCDAIYRLSIRGAPAIGVAGAYACVLSKKIFYQKLEMILLKNFSTTYEIENASNSN